jgi:hypothetical protein
MSPVFSAGAGIAKFVINQTICLYPSGSRIKISVSFSGPADHAQAAGCHRENKTIFGLAISPIFLRLGHKSRHLHVIGSVQIFDLYSVHEF